MKKNRILYSLLALALSLTSVIGLGSCGEAKPAETTAETTTAAPETTEAEPIKTPDRDINVAVLAGPTGMGAAKLIADSKSEKTELSYNFTVDTNPPAVAASVISGEYDIAALPTNLAASLYNKTGGKVLCAAVNTGGVLYVLENGDTIHSVEDLRGKTVYSTGQASTPEYILNYILRKNGLEPGTDVTVEYLSEHSELAAKMISGEVSLGVLPRAERNHHPHQGSRESAHRAQPHDRVGKRCRRRVEPAPGLRCRPRRVCGGVSRGCGKSSSRNIMLRSTI